MEAPKRIWAWVDDLAGIVGQSDEPETPPNLPAGPNAISPCAEYILATEHARIVAEKDARIAELEEALEWYSDETQYVNTCEQLLCGCCTDIFKPIERDEGSIARATLKGDDNG